MTIKIDLKPFLIALLSGAIAVGLVTGAIQEEVPFTDPLAELLATVLTSTLAIISLITSINK